MTDENENSRKRIISIPDSSKEEMYELTKKEFLRENGVCNGDTTKRTDVYNNLYRKMSKKDRLAAGYTLEKYERIYRQAFYDAAKTADPNWELVSQSKLEHLMMLQERLQRQENPLHRQHLILKSKRINYSF